MNCFNAHLLFVNLQVFRLSCAYGFYKQHNRTTSLCHHLSLAPYIFLSDTKLSNYSSHQDQQTTAYSANCAYEN